MVDLVRVVREHDGSLTVSRTAPGRGAWLCRDSPHCVDQAVRRRAFERALRGTVSPDQVEQVKKDLQTGPAGRRPEGSEDRVV
jgi:predicted RNA-binding protein YlxR (DUF448 family)